MATQRRSNNCEDFQDGNYVTDDDWWLINDDGDVNVDYYVDHDTDSDNKDNDDHAEISQFNITEKI